jgi:allophanate hydrolase subunit 2
VIAASWLEPSSESIRVILGPQDDYFEASSIQALLEESFSLAARFDRMAYWLNGPVLKHSSGFNIVSDGIALGAIQVLGNGQPIVLMADRQSTGGYPKIANVIRADIGRVAQKRPGEQLRFERCDPDQAQEILLEVHAKLDAFADVLMPAGSLDSEFLLTCNLISGVSRAVQ